jgi:hypothetical protein
VLWQPLEVHYVDVERRTLDRIHRLENIPSLECQVDIEIEPSRPLLSKRAEEDDGTHRRVRRANFTRKTPGFIERIRSTGSDGTLLFLVLRLRVLIMLSLT